MSRKNLQVCGCALSLVIPFGAYAQATGGVRDLIDSVSAWIDIAAGLAFGLAVVAFFYGLALYIFKAGDAGANTQGIRLMIWGVVALFVMASIWGLVALLQQSFGVDNATPATFPQIGDFNN